MKFRCERDTLADAIGVAQRAVASRTGALPVLSGLRVSPTSSGVELVGSDLLQVVLPSLDASIVVSLSDPRFVSRFTVLLTRWLLLFLNISSTRSVGLVWSALSFSDGDKEPEGQKLTPVSPILRGGPTASRYVPPVFHVDPQASLKRNTH